MTFTPGTPASVTAFLAIVAAVLFAVFTGDFLSRRRLGIPRPTALRLSLLLAVGTLAWLTATSAVVAGGALSVHPMPRLPIFIAAAILTGLLLALSPVGGRLAGALPLSALVAFQAFRLPLELVLHNWAASGTVPGTMTWTGQNWDIVTGILAVLAAPLSTADTPRGRSVAWAFNVAGSALLLNVMRVAVMSSPLPFAWTDVNPPLQLAMHLPYAHIVTVCVAGALAGHVVLTRALLRAAAAGRRS